jgi:hypothetical protein
MAGMLLLNPRKRRRKAATGAKRRTRSRKPNPAWFKKGHVAKTRRHRRTRTGPHAIVTRANPVRRRRRNPIRHVRHYAARRRHHRNPLAGFGGITSLLMDGAIMAAGGIGFDLLYGQINSKLPASLQVNSTTVGAGDAVKLLATVAAGTFLSRMTRGLSQKLALGAVTVQLYDIISGTLPASISSQMHGVGFMNPGPTVTGQPWVKRSTPLPRYGGGMSALLPAGHTSPTMAGVSALLPGGATSSTMHGLGRLRSVTSSSRAGMRL